MPRTARAGVGGYAYHVLNRANGRLRLFKKAADFQAFERILADVFEWVPLRILAYTLMGNHWHFVVWPKRGQDDEVSEFFRRLTVTHSISCHTSCNGPHPARPDGEHDGRLARLAAPPVDPIRFIRMVK